MITASAALSLLGVNAAQAAAHCPDTSVGGKTIGWVKVDGQATPIKEINYPRGGELNPPDSAVVAGISQRHRSLMAQEGTTVLTWHVRFGTGCDGSLNKLLKKPMGYQFRIEKLNGETEAYQLVDRATVPKGKYRASWFRKQGSPQLALFTCTGWRDGAFRNTTALFAEPVRPVDSLNV